MIGLSYRAVNNMEEGKMTTAAPNTFQYDILHRTGLRRNRRITFTIGKDDYDMIVAACGPGDTPGGIVRRAIGYMINHPEDFDAARENSQHRGERGTRPMTVAMSVDELDALNRSRGDMICSGFIRQSVSYMFDHMSDMNKAYPSFRMMTPPHLWV